MSACFPSSLIRFSYDVFHRDGSSFMTPIYYLPFDLQRFGQRTLPPSEPRTCMRPETGSRSVPCVTALTRSMLSCYGFQHIHVDNPLLILLLRSRTNCLKFLARFLTEALTRVWGGKAPWIQCTVLPGLKEKTSSKKQKALFFSFWGWTVEL